MEDPPFLKDLYRAVQWLLSSMELFAGEVTEPSVLQLNEEDQMEALRVLREEDPADDARDPFMFTFQGREDMEVFLKANIDQQGLKVNAMFI